MSKRQQVSDDILEYQPDAVEIEERPVPGKIRWVLYILMLSLILVVIGTVLFKVDRIVVAQGKLITTTPTIVVQPLSTAIIRSIEVRVGDVVEKDQPLATLDSTFAAADLSQLTQQKQALAVQLRRIQAEVNQQGFAATAAEGEDGRMQEKIFRQRRLILESSRRATDDKIASFAAKLELNATMRQGQEAQLKLLRDLEGTTAKLPQNGEEYRIRLLDSQKARFLASSTLDNLKAEELVTIKERKQVESDWQRFVAERDGELMEEAVKTRNELEKVLDEISKASRMTELVVLKAPEKAVVLKMAERSVGSIIQQAELFATLVPFHSVIEAEVDIESKDIGRVRPGDSVRIKLDAFPFQRHDTLPGTIRIISEDAEQRPLPNGSAGSKGAEPLADAFYPSRIALLSNKLLNVPEGFRLLPGMKVRAEIKVGKRSVISYFLYPIIRALDESLREP